MANDSHHQNRTVIPNFEPFSSSECIAWLTVLNIEAVAIVTMNALTIIINLKERILRKRSMYLVISLAVADMFVACNLIFESLRLGSNCNLWTINQYRGSKIFIAFILWHFFPLASVTNLAAISLERVHETFLPFKHRLIKKKIFGAAVAGVWFTAALGTAMVISPLFLELSDITIHHTSRCYCIAFYYCCFLLVHRY